VSFAPLDLELEMVLALCQNMIKLLSSKTLWILQFIKQFERIVIVFHQNMLTALPTKESSVSYIYGKESESYFIARLPTNIKNFFEAEGALYVMMAYSAQSFIMLVGIFHLMFREQMW